MKQLPQQTLTKRKIPEHFNWYEVQHHRLPEGSYIVAAAHETQAATIVGKMHGIYIDADEPGAVTFIRKVQENERTYDRIMPKSKWQCPNCGYSDPNRFTADRCPQCDTPY